jgi:hypothetical protein
MKMDENLVMMMDDSCYWFGDGEMRQSQEYKKYVPGRNILTHLVKSTWLAVCHLNIYCKRSWHVEMKPSFERVQAR